MGRLSVVCAIFRPPKRLLLGTDDNDDGDNDDDIEKSEPKRQPMHQKKACAKQRCDHPPPPDPPRFPFTPLQITSVQSTAVGCPASNECPLTGNDFDPESNGYISVPVVVSKINQLASDDDTQENEENLHPSTLVVDEITADAIGPSCIPASRMMTPIDVQFSVDESTEGNTEYLQTPRCVARLHVQDSFRTVRNSVGIHHQSITGGGGRPVNAYHMNSLNVRKSMSEPRPSATGNSHVTAQEAVGKK